MASGLAEHLDEQVGTSIDDGRLLAEAAWELWEAFPLQAETTAAIS